MGIDKRASLEVKVQRFSFLLNTMIILVENVTKRGKRGK